MGGGGEGDERELHTLGEQVSMQEAATSEDHNYLLEFLQRRGQVSHSVRANSESPPPLPPPGGSLASWLGFRG